jgi:hypothetical protein
LILAGLQSFDFALLNPLCQDEMGVKTGYGALELCLVAEYSIESELTDQKFAFFCETLKQSTNDWS